MQQIERLAGAELRVVRNDEFDPDTLIAERPRAIIISPGPGTPSRAGRVLELIRALGALPSAPLLPTSAAKPSADACEPTQPAVPVPLLGVCLGHQAIGEAFGARVTRGALPIHGKVTDVQHHGRHLFAGCPSPMQTARYHSLVVDRSTLSDEFEVDAETSDGVVMAMSHRTRPIFGIQFHPESYGTTGGDRLIMNFLEVAR